MSDVDELFTLTPDSPREVGVESARITELREELGLERCRYKPFAHQVVGIHSLVKHPFFGLFDEMGAGKTLQAIVAACVLFCRGVINRVIIMAPAGVRAVWYDEEFGELTKHIFPSMSAKIVQYHSQTRSWERPALEVDPAVKPVSSEWVITNYELLRRGDWLGPLLPYATSKTFLILDESSAIKSWKAQQTKAAYTLRKRCGRVVLLNGTPIANNPMDLFAQGNILSPSILDCKFITSFKARYAMMGGYEVETKWGKKVPTQVIGWRNLPDLQARFAPYVLRRLKKDCLSDLPPKLDPVIIPVPLTETTWKYYKMMRDDMVAYLSMTQVSQTMQVLTKMMRLSQITSGFIGGVESLDGDVDDTTYEKPEWLDDSLFEGVSEQTRAEIEAAVERVQSGAVAKTLLEVGREKLDAFLAWLDIRLDEDPSLKLLVWCRFRPELDRAMREVRERYPSFVVGSIRGGQTKAERTEALKLLDPRFAPAGPAVVFSTSAGSMGFTLTASHTVARLSRDYSLFVWTQSDDRVHRPGQTSPVSYTDFVATGPKGQKTMDVIILRALLAKEDLSKLTAAPWIRSLSEL